MGLTNVKQAVLLVSGGQLFKFCLIKLKTLVALFLTDYICGDHDMILSIATYGVPLSQDYSS